MNYKKWILLISFIFLSQTVIAAQRIISLAPSITEILYCLNLDDEIVGVTTFCNYPAKALKKEKIGTFSTPDVEKILSLKPDIIFATSLEQKFIVKKLKQLNLNIHISAPSNIQALFESITEIGKLTNREKQAKKLIHQMKAKIKKVNKKVGQIPVQKRQKVFIEIWHDPLMTVGKDSFINELIDIAGGVNIAKDIARNYSYFSAEQVIKRNPDCIILGYMVKDKSLHFINKRLGWSQINAVKNNQIFSDINSDLFLRPGPRVVEGIKEIHARLYPRKKIGYTSK
jgi:iron complex transport system substrate-binding protein